MFLLDELLLLLAELLLEDDLVLELTLLDLLELLLFDLVEEDLVVDDLVEEDLVVDERLDLVVADPDLVVLDLVPTRELLVGLD